MPFENAVVLAAEETNDPDANFKFVCKEADMIYQTNKSSLHYINGHKIDLNYEFKKNLKNKFGTQDYYIGIDASAIRNVSNIRVIKYVSSTRPITPINAKFVLAFDVFGKNVYTIDCRGRGAYSSITHIGRYSTVCVLIDPDTGNLVDILKPNYYYDIVQGTSNKILYFNRSWKFILSE